MRNIVRLSVLWAFALPLGAAQGDDVAELKQRVHELEEQNRQILARLAELEGRLPKSEPANEKAAAPARRAPAPVLWSEITDDERRFKPYGMLRMDVDLDTQRPNNSQTPLFITSPDARAGGKGGSFSIHPRLTRVGLDVTGPEMAALGGARGSGKLEVDFENGGSESRQLIRIRHAYFKADWGRFSVLGGQTWDIFSPLFPTVNNDTLMWNAGNVGDRRPQLRLAYEPRLERSQFSFAFATGLSGAVDPVDLDGNGFRDGEQSMRPNLQSRVGYSRVLWVGQRAASVGASTFNGWMTTTRDIGGRTLFHTAGYNVDFTLPLAAALDLRGEGWWGRNMSDFRGGAGQGIVLGREVRGRGGWSELKLKLSRYWSIAPGFTTDNPVAADLAAGSRLRNRAFYFGNRFTPAAKVELGLDYLRWRTDYKALPSGFDNRVNLFVQFGF